MRYAMQHCVVEWSFRSGKAYPDPFNDVQLDLVITAPDGTQARVPTFWAGENRWRARYAPPAVGRYQVHTDCSDPQNPDLHGVADEIEVTAYEGNNPLLSHGPLRVSQDRRRLEHSDGTPFLWLADTWWMGLCQRLRWPDQFHALIADRVAKGFSVIQIIAGLYPDMPWGDPRGRNEAGLPWELDFSRINPAYFDMADLRIAALVEAGLLPCIVGSWGYFLPWMGVERAKQHWRNLIARWGAYPVVWCLAGEATMAYYLSETGEADSAFQRQGWTEVGAYVRHTDPHQRPITIHPTSVGRDQVTDDSVLDFNMLQTGHGGKDSVAFTVSTMVQQVAREPRMPVLNGEVCYEGIMESSREEIQRFMFWACMLSGACGHSYGANGIWQLNLPGQPYGPSPHGLSWGDRPWTEASALPGSSHVGLGRQILLRYPWWRLVPAPEAVDPHWTADNYWLPYCAQVPGELWIVYMPTNWFLAPGQLPTVKGLASGATYRAVYINPSDGTERDAGPVQVGTDGSWQAPMPGVLRDWLLIVERVG